MQGALKLLSFKRASKSSGAFPIVLQTANDEIHMTTLQAEKFIDELRNAVDFANGMPTSKIVKIPYG